MSNPTVEALRYMIKTSRLPRTEIAVERMKGYITDAERDMLYAELEGENLASQQASTPEPSDQGGTK